MDPQLNLDSVVEFFKKCNIEIDYRDSIQHEFPLYIEFVDTLPGYSHANTIFLEVKVLARLTDGPLKNNYRQKLMQYFTQSLKEIYEVTSQNKSITLLEFHV